MKNKKKLNINKASLVEATMLAMQGKLILEEEKEIKTEDIEVETDDVEVTLGTDKTIIDSEEATITIEKNNESTSIETEPETVEVPVEGDETIIPEEVVEPEEVEDEAPSIDEIVDEEIPSEELDTSTQEVVEPEEETMEESKSLEEDLTSEEFPEDGTYWSGNGKYQEDVDMLNKLIPATGTTPTIPDVLPDKVVEDYINLSNKYYRWFNDGDVPFKKLKDGTTIYPSYTRGNNRQTPLGQKTCNSISFDLENRVNSLIEKINSQYPDWRAKLQPAETVADNLQESKEVEKIEEAISSADQLVAGKLYDFVANNYTSMDLELLKEIALNAIYELNDDAKIIADIKERMMESKELNESIKPEDDNGDYNYFYSPRQIIEICEDRKYEHAFDEESGTIEELEKELQDVKRIESEKPITTIEEPLTDKYPGWKNCKVKTILKDGREFVSEEDTLSVWAAVQLVVADEIKEESKGSCENCNKENCDCDNKEIKTESKNKFNANSFKTVVEGFLKELDETVDSFKLNKVLKNESAIRIYGEILSQDNSKNICLEGKMIQKGKAFTKYEIAKPSGLKLESKEFTRSSMVTFTNKENILECKYFKQATAKVEE